MTNNENWEQFIDPEHNSNPSFDDSSIPTDFRSSLLPKSNPFDLSNISDIIYALTISHEPQQILHFLEENPRISILTIATGLNNEMQLLHNINSSEAGDNPKQFAFSGLGKSANVLDLITSRLFHSTTSQAPSFNTLKDHNHLAQISTFEFEREQLEDIEVSNAIVITPDIAEIITPEGQLMTNPNEALKQIAEHLIEVNARKKAEFESAQLDDEGNSDLSNHQEWNDEPIKKAIRLLQTIYAWSKQKSARSIAFRLSQDTQALELLSTTTSLFQTNLPPSPTPATQDQITPDGPNPFNTTNIAQSGDTTNVNDILNVLSTSHATSMNKLAYSLELFSNTTAQSIKEKSKIGKQVKNVLLNIMTPDGENPATELTETMSDIMKSNISEVQLTIDIILNKHNAPAKPTPDLIRSIKNGKWHHEEGEPEGVCVFNLPATLNNTPFEDFDFNQLDGEERRGRNLTDKERAALYGKDITVSRTMNHLLAKCKSYAALVKETLGDCPFTEEVENWVAFINNNLYKLSNRQRLFDPVLAARIESLFDSHCNEFIANARFEVPDLNLLDANQLRQQVLRGTIKPALPTAVEEALNPSTKTKNDRKRRANPNDTHTGPDKRTPFQIVTHNNQPRELNMSTEKFRLVIQFQISKNRVAVPEFPSKNCDECCKFIFLGQCNSKCPRAAAHISPAGNKTRMDALRKFIQDCLLAYKENKKPSDPDFH